MIRSRFLSAAIVAVACSSPSIGVCAPPSAARPATASAAPAEPLRLVAPAADFVLKVEKPRAIADLIVLLAGKPELQGFRGYRDFIGSTNYQLFRQLVAHFESELGHSWPDLLDQVAGGGIVVAVKFQPKQPAPVLLVLQGRDPKLTARFFQNLRAMVADEQARQGTTESYKSETYRGIETYQVGKDLYAAALDAALVYSNLPQTLHTAIDQHLDPTKPNLLDDKALAEGRSLVAPDSLAWAWLSLNYAHQSPEVKTLFQLPSTFFPEHVLFGGFLDVARRSPCLVASIRPESGGLALAVQLPRGTDGMHELVRAHVPPPGQPGALPLLCPEGTLYSTSFYLDLGEFWKQRTVLLPAELVKQFEAGDKRSEAILQGTRFSQFLEFSGTRHRFVVARQENTGYSFQSDTHYPAFAWVMELRTPDSFASAIDKPLIGLAFLAGLQVPLDSIDETYKGVKISGYRFVENDANKARAGGRLFNFSPCRAKVGNQYIISSTHELARQLVDTIQKEASQKESPANAASQPGSPSSGGPSSGSANGRSAANSSVTTVHSRLVWGGVSDYLGYFKKQFITRNMLEQGNSPEGAAKEISLLLNLIDQLGTLETNTRIEPNRYEFDVRIVP
ncbi:MAG TPA: DUF3352 domain-containing protein [Pirellulales bacterium]|jgi:hypothetical protein|nr:DUF3352 domain-containing protein [Pirellulales bacterium]